MHATLQLCSPRTTSDGYREGGREGSCMFAPSAMTWVTAFQRDQSRTRNTEAEWPGGHQERSCTPGGERARPACPCGMPMGTDQDSGPRGAGLREEQGHGPGIKPGSVWYLGGEDRAAGFSVCMLAALGLKESPPFVGGCASYWLCDHGQVT